MSKRRLQEKTEETENLKRPLAEWKDELHDRLTRKEPEMLSAVLPALNAYPGNGHLLLMAAIAALLEEKPAQSQIFVQRFTKRYVPFEHEDKLLTVIALAQQGRWTLAWQIIEKQGLVGINRSFSYLPGGWELRQWFHGWMRKIEREAKKQIATALKDAQKKRGKAKPPTTKKETPPTRTPIHITGAISLC